MLFNKLFNKDNYFNKKNGKIIRHIVFFNFKLSFVLKVKLFYKNMKLHLIIIEIICTYTLKREKSRLKWV